MIAGRSPLRINAALSNLPCVLREYMRCRFRLRPGQDSLELIRAATLASLRRSSHCVRWEISEDVDDPTRLVLRIEWKGDADHEVFRGSLECADFFRVLRAQVRELEESEYHANAALLRESLGGTEGMLQLVFDVLHEVSADALLGPCFGPRGSERVTRLGWWLIEVLGGPKLYALTVPEQPLRDGPLPEAPLDVEERAQLLQIVRRALFISGGRLHCAVSALEANLPLHPALPSGPHALLPELALKDVVLSA